MTTSERSPVARSLSSTLPFLTAFLPHTIWYGFLQLEYGRVGADTHLTPREVIRDFVELLDILHQNPGTTIESILAGDGSGAGDAPSSAGAPVATTPAAGNTVSVATPNGGVTLAGAAPLGSTAAGAASTIAGASRPAEGASNRDFSGFKL